MEKRSLKNILIAATMAISATTATVTEADAQQVKNVVLVHGAFADGSGYKGVYEALTKQGYHVTVVQNPLTSLEDDVAATKLALDAQDGPAILAGHSWGGAVFTQAGKHPQGGGVVFFAPFHPG